MWSQPIHLVSVNNAPPRAAMLVGQLLESLQNEYNILHVANCVSIQDLRIVLGALVESPGILICSSQWTITEQQEANRIARSVFPNVKVINISPGLDTREGGEGIIKFLQQAVRSAGIPTLGDHIDR